MIIDELLVALGYEYDNEEAKQFKKDLDNTITSVKNLVIGVGALATAITGFVTVVATASDEQGKLADEFNTTVEKLDALDFAQKRVGGTSQGLVSTLSNLSSRISEAARGTGSGVEAFSLLGVNVTDANGNLKDTVDVLKEVSTSFSNISNQQRIEFSEKLGIRDSLRLLKQGPIEIQNLIDEGLALGVVTQKDAELSAKFKDELTNLWAIINQISRVIAAELLPVFIEINKTIKEWWLQNRAIIEQNLPSFIDNLTTAIKFLTLAFGVFVSAKIITFIGSLLTLMKGLTVASLAAAASTLLLPTLLTAAAAAFVAMVEDAKVFFDGGESVIGDLLKSFPQWREEILTVSAALATVADLTLMIFDGWSKIFDLFSSFNLENIKNVISNLPGFFGDLTGIAPITNDSVTNNSLHSSNSTTVVEKLEILVDAGINNVEEIGQQIFNTFQQATEDLKTAVDQ